MRIDVNFRPLAQTDNAILRTATLTNMNWTGEERLSYRDIDQRPDMRHYFDLQADRGDFGFAAERSGLVLGVARHDVGDAGVEA